MENKEWIKDYSNAYYSNSLKLLKQYSLNNCPWVRCAVANNPNTTKDILETLKNDSSFLVKEIVQERLKEITQ